MIGLNIVCFVLQNLDTSITTRELHDTFADFGDILACKVATDKEGHSKGYGFVHFSEPAAAKKAIENVNGAQLGESEKVVTVTEFISKQERGDPKKDFTNIYVKHLPPSITTENELKEMFQEYGEISSVALMKVSVLNSCRQKYRARVLYTCGVVIGSVQLCLINLHLNVS